MSDTNFSIAVHQFQEKLELHGYSQRCIDDYPRTAGHFFTWLTDHESIQVFNDITQDHVRAYQCYIQFEHKNRGKALATGGVCSRLTALKTFFRIMSREKLIPRDLSQHIIIPKYHYHVPRYIPNQQQMKHLLNMVNEPTVLGIRDRAMFELLYATGIRSEEIRTVQVEDWDRYENTLFVSGKGSKDRIVPVGNWVVPYLQEYLVTSRPKLVYDSRGLFFVSKSGIKLARYNLGKILNRYVKHAGLPHITVHTFRHACATHMLENGADIRYVQELLGHSNLSATQIYTKVNIRLLKRAHGAYHPREQQNNGK